MILSGMRSGILFGILAICAGQAQADVLEIGDEGARWVTGPDAENSGGQQAHYDRQGRIIYAAAMGGNAPAKLAAGMAPEIAAEMAANGIPREYSAKIAELSVKYGLSPQLLAALVWQESRWRSDAVSPAGARGLAQLMPATAHYLGVDPDDPLANLEGGARYLREQIDRFDGDLERALAAYNAGPGRVMQAGGIPPIRETRQYVASIMDRLNQQAQTQPAPSENAALPPVLPTILAAALAIEDQRDN